MISALNRLRDGTIELTITIPQKRVKAVYEKTLEKRTRETTVKGFRKGKAPQKLIEQQFGKNKIFEEVLQILLPETYIKAVKEQNFKPILNPQIQVISLQEDKDWQFKATTCEAPNPKLGDYKDAVRQVLAAEKIWVPGKDEKKQNKKTASQTYNQKMNKVFKTLLDKVSLDLPEILVEQEVNRMLSRLIDQTNKLGLTVDDYLQSAGKTQEQLRQEYRQQAQQTLKLEFILTAIADQEKITVSDAAVAEMISAIPDEKTKEGFKTTAQKAYIRHLLKKRQVIDKLMKL